MLFSFFLFNALGASRGLGVLFLKQTEDPVKDMLSNPLIAVLFFIAANPWVPVLAVIALVVAIVIYRKRKKKKWGDIDLQIPATRRTNLLFGYYSSLERTFDQVKADVNMFWSGFYGRDTWLKVLKEGNQAFVFDLAGDLTIKVDGKLIARDNREELLRETFMDLRNHGVLHKIAYLYPIDEPQLSMKGPEEFLKIVNTVKKVKAEFEELANARLMTIFLRGQPFWHVKELDVVGVDDYDQKSESLTIGEHARLLKELAPGQKTVLVPGPGYGHNPDPWVAYALLNPDQVEMIAAFLWFDDPNHKDENFTGLENASPELQAQWRRAAHICMATPGY